VILEVGGHYRNKFGEYEVLTIKGDSMEVQYLDGHQQTLSIKIQARIQEGLLRETQQVDDHKYSRIKPYHRIGDNAYWTAGFLLVRLARLSANLKGDKASQDRFQDDYFIATGRRLSLKHEAICVLREGANQQGNQGVLRFSANNSELPLLEFSSDGDKHNKPFPVGDTADLYEVKDIRFLFFLFENGFDLGNKQDNGIISSKIPIQYKDSFNSGHTFGKGNNQKEGLWK